MRSGIFTYERKWCVDGSSVWNVESDDKYTYTKIFEHSL